MTKQHNFRPGARLLSIPGSPKPAAAPAAAPGPQDIKAMLTSKANTDPRDPEHAATRAAINAHYESLAGADQVVD